MKRILTFILVLFMVGHVRASYFDLEVPLSRPATSSSWAKPLHTTSSANVYSSGSAGGNYYADRDYRIISSFRSTQSVLNLNTNIRTVQSYAVADFSRGGVVGRFSTYVPSVNNDSYTHRPRRVNGEDDDDDPEEPNQGNVVPIGDTPWLWISLMLIGYFTTKCWKKRTFSIEK